LCRAGLVDVDPLVVIGDIGEGVDGILIHRHPLGGAEFGSDERFDLVDAVECAHSGSPLILATFGADCAASRRCRATTSPGAMTVPGATTVPGAAIRRAASTESGAAIRRAAERTID